MKKILPVALAAVLLAGCGSANSFTAARASHSAISAQSKAGAEKGVRAMFRLIFSQLDADKSGSLSVAEMPAAVGTSEPGEPVDPLPYKQAMFEKLDVNKNGRVTLNEFASRQHVTTITAKFRNQVGVTFARLDMNGDRLLQPEELATGPVPFEAADKNKNGKVTLSELEDALAAALAPAPAPPAEEPANPPAEDPAAPAEPTDPAQPQEPSGF